MVFLRRLLARKSRGQIAIPSLFVIPSMFLFVFLIYETAKLSREKIRHQFAVDAASFVEMTNYADFLNRTAYVNGAFPMRIFAEGFFTGPNIPKKKNDALTETLYNILHCNSAFPRKPGGGNPLQEDLDLSEKWEIKFTDGSEGCSGIDRPQNSQGTTTQGNRNSQTPDVDHTCNGKEPCLELLTKNNALEFYLSWEDAQDIYKLYVQIYQLLGSVEDAQFSVFKRLTQGANPHTFFRKSYWLNTGDPVAKAAEGAAYFSKHQFVPKAKCVRYINIVGNKPTNDPYQPYKQVEPNSPIEMPKTVTQELCDTDGLFQMAYMKDPSHITDLTSKSSADTDWPGYVVIQHWDPPANYFKVNFSDVCDFAGGNGPCVHSTIALTGPRAIQNGSAGIWPNPTPKFQTRLYP